MTPSHITSGRILVMRAALAMVLLAGPGAAAAQNPQPAAPVVPDTTFTAQRSWSALRIAKWTLAAAAAAAAGYGYYENRRADDRFERLEQTCVAEPERCDATLPDGSYADAELEAEFQAIRAMDRRARTGLLAGQIGVAASVVLFIIDLRQDSAPENIPYDPRRFEVGRSRDGGLSLRVNVAF